MKKLISIGLILLCLFTLISGCKKELADVKDIEKGEPIISSSATELTEHPIGS